MADYNVNMKQWNGTSFDNVLPLAYNAKQLEGQSLAEVKQWVQDNGLLLYTGQYNGTGTYGATKPVSIQFPFEPKLFIFPISASGDYPASSLLDTSFLTTSYKQVGRVIYVRSIAVYGEELMARFSDSSRKKLQIYSTKNAFGQSNESGKIYYFAAIGGYDMGETTEWAITSSGTWTVPKTGRYYIELYGYGGAGQGRVVPYASGGASCQSYDSIVLTKGQVINVSIGSYDGTTTSFGSYTVANAGDASIESPYYGVGSGNKGKNGAYSSIGHTGVTVGNGVLSANYGVGQSSQDPYGATGRSGAVYLKYLGA